MKRVKILVTILVCLCLGRSEAALETLHFQDITHSNATNAATGESQLILEVSDVFQNGTLVPNQVLFTFKNIGIQASVITEIYFDDSPLLGIASIVNNPPNVVFAQGANPKELPGAKSVNPVFKTTEGFLAQASSPAPKKGVNQGEQIGIKFNLIAGKTYQDVINAIGNNSLRAGLHVTGFANGGSESFINNKSFVSVPEPATVALLGLSGMVLLRKRKI